MPRSSDRKPRCLPAQAQWRLALLLGLFRAQYATVSLAMNESQRKTQLVKLWRRRPPEKRMRNDVSSFYGWVEVNRPDLLLRREGAHPFRHFLADLSAHIYEPDSGQVA